LGARPHLGDDRTMRPNGVYYGWLVVAALCVTETVTWGIVYERVFWLLAAALAAVGIGVFAAGTETRREPSKLGSES